MTTQETQNATPKIKYKRGYSPAQRASQQRMINGEIKSPGRPKGSRNKFAEAFVQDFMADWEEHGADALKRCRENDVAAYISAAARIMPKDFNINMTQEVNLEKLLSKFSTEELRDLAAGLAAIGARSRQDVIEGKITELPD